MREVQQTWTEDNEQERVITWLRNGASGEATDEEAVSAWLAESGLGEALEAEASWIDWVSNIGQGLASGAATGSVVGPWGTAIGALLGGGLGALQTATQPTRPSPAPPSQPLQPTPAAPSPQATLMPVAPPQTAPVPAARSIPPAAAPSSTSLSPQLVQQLVALLPLVTQLLSQRTTPTRSGETIESSGVKDNGDFVSSDVQLSGAGAQVDDERGIDAPGAETVEISTEADPPSEYPNASRFVPAAVGNYREYQFVPVRNSSGASATLMPAPFYWRPIRRIVIHITDGGSNINGTISWFQNPAAGVSAHYIVGQDGEVVQMVRHKDIAYHAHAANTDSVGIEHVARSPGSFHSPPDPSPGLFPTQAQYCASAALVRWLCDQYNIPIDRQHIQGHSEADSHTTHLACPNSVWNWDYYMSLVLSSSCLPFPPGVSAGAENRTESENSPTVEATSPPLPQGILALPALGWGEELAGISGFEIATESVASPAFEWGV